ncbi:MAG TPA: inorganic phosphate transporter [Candidatus Limnocylindria bacterium]
MPEWLTLGLAIVLVLAVAFDYINGFHDTANAIATSVSTRALRPAHAIGLSAAANFVGALTGTAVATTIAAGLVDENLIDLGVVAAALAGAIVWNLITWRLGIPSSSSHALIGGLLGASVVHAGLAAWNVPGIIEKVLIPLVTSPLIGFALGIGAMIIILNVFRRRNPKTLNGQFRRAQIGSATFMAFSHGSNDAQKTMGIITLALFTAGAIDEFVVPLWVILVSATAISLGTAAGGWRIIKTMGTKVVKLDPVHGFAAETTAALVILGASRIGVPVSTTHVISSAILGVGSATNLKAVRWIVARSIAIAWVLTIPAAGLVAALAYFLTRTFFGGV